MRSLLLGATPRLHSPQCAFHGTKCAAALILTLVRAAYEQRAKSGKLDMSAAQIYAYFRVARALARDHYLVFNGKAYIGDVVAPRLHVARTISRESHDHSSPAQPNSVYINRFVDTQYSVSFGVMASHRLPALMVSSRPYRPLAPEPEILPFDPEAPAADVKIALAAARWRERHQRKVCC